jgi:hypothetical protein
MRIDFKLSLLPKRSFDCLLSFAFLRQANAIHGIVIKSYSDFVWPPKIGFGRMFIAFAFHPTA